MTILISIILLLFGIATSIKWEENKDLACAIGQPIQTGLLWVSVALMVLSFIVFYCGGVR